MNLNEKILQLRKKVEIMKKDKSGFNFKYVTEEKILMEIKGEMEELKLLLEPKIVPNTLQFQNISYKNKKGIEVNDTIIKSDMIFTWTDVESGETKDIPWGLIGQQEEASQAFGSGLTYAQRYFLLKYFNIATTADDPDELKKQQEEKEKEIAQKTIQSARNKITILFAELVKKYQTKDKVYKTLGIAREKFVSQYDSTNILELQDLIEQMEVTIKNA